MLRFYDLEMNLKTVQRWYDGYQSVSYTHLSDAVLRMSWKEGDVPERGPTRQIRKAHAPTVTDPGRSAACGPILIPVPAAAGITGRGPDRESASRWMRALLRRCFQISYPRTR